MEAISATTFVMDDPRSFETADTRGRFEHPNGASQTSASLHSLRVSLPSDEATLSLEREEAQVHERKYAVLQQNNTEDYQSLPTHIAASPEPSQDDAVDPVGNFECPPVTSGTQWRPSYLRRRILAAFSFIFLLMIALLELLSLLSARNDGIAKGQNKDHYLWTYGPTAFLTLIAALFNRVEYQTKLMAPWERLSKYPTPAQRTLLLDYISPLQPVTIYQSLRNKDFAVAATTTVSVLIKLLIVLSSGLITLSRISVHHDAIPMEMQDAFVDDDSRLLWGNSLPYFIMQGRIEGSSYPRGISNEFAFQSIQSNLPDTAQYQVVVDGLRTDLQCEIADLDMTGAILVGTSGLTLSNLSLTAPGCGVVLENQSGSSPQMQDADEPNESTLGTFEPVLCHGTTDKAGMRVLVMFLSIEWPRNETLPTEEADFWCSQGYCEDVYQGRLLESVQLLCTPTYEIAKVNVVQNGTEVHSVMPVDPVAGEARNRTLDHISPWSFAQAYFPGFSGSPEWSVFNVSQKRLYLDSYMENLMASQHLADFDIFLLYNPTFIESIAAKYYRQIGAVIAKQLFMEPTSVNTTGSAKVMEDRLVVREWAVQWMVGLVSVCLLLSVFTALIIPRHGTLHQTPSTLPGIAALIAHSPDLLEQLRYSGDAISETLRHQLKGSKFQLEVVRYPSQELDEAKQHIILKYVILASTGKLPWSFHQTESTHSHPWALHPVSRLGLGFILVALVITLEVTLHQSRSHDGLGSVGDNAYIHYTWTSLPTLLFGCIALMLSSMDFSIRSLAPYTSLSKVVTGNNFRTLEFLDMSVPSALVKEAKLRNIGALATTTTLLIASFFTIFSGSLFQGVSFSSTNLALLRVNNSFGPASAYTKFGVAAPLILLSNSSYPSFTYEDLAFPQFLPALASTASNTSLLSVKAVVPALRSRLDCRSYNTSMIQSKIEHTTPVRNDTVMSPEEMFLKIAVDEKDCLYGGDDNVHFDINSNVSYFGADSSSSLSSVSGQGSNTQACSDYLFIWGKLAGTKVEHVAAMGCNQSVEAVDVETNFIGADLAIDLDNPPRPVPKTERNSTASLDPALNRVSLYRNLPSIPTDELLSDVFTILTHSRWAIALSMLGGGSDDAVAAAIRFQHGVILAQALNEGRVSADKTNTTLTPEQVLAGESDAGRTFEATVVDNTGRQRVVQDAVSTRVLEALLLTVLVLLGVGWWWLPKTDVLPKRSPTTIASAVALLAGGNLMEWLSEQDGDITSVLGGRGNTTRFWMGWGNVPDEEGALTGNENENGISRFGIFAFKADRVDER